jgi:hypothetical protein
MPYFPTNDFGLYDPTDPTKVIKFAANVITTGTARTASMPDSDVTIGGGAGGSATFGRATVDFTTGFESAVVTVADAGVGAGSNIIAGMVYAATPDGRDIDEVICETFEVKAGNLVVGVSFDILVTSLVGPAYGQFYVDYVRD